MKELVQIKLVIGRLKYRIELTIEPSHSKRKNFKAVQEEITRLVIEKRITSVIILDRQIIYLQQY